MGHRRPAYIIKTHYFVLQLPVKDDCEAHMMYFMNDGVYGSFNCVLYDHQQVVAQPLMVSPTIKLYSI